MALPICSLRSVPTASVVRGTKMTADAEAGDDVRQNDVAHGHLQVQPAQEKAGQARSTAKPNPASRRGSTLLDQRADKKQRDQRADSARADGQPGIKGGVTQQRLEKQRLQRQSVHRGRSRTMQTRRSSPRSCGF